MPATAKKQPAKKTTRNPQPAAVAAPEESKNAQGKAIQAAMSAALMTQEQLAEKTGYSLARVEEHVSYEISKGRSKLNGKKQVVVVSQPRYRAG